MGGFGFGFAVLSDYGAGSLGTAVAPDCSLAGPCEPREIAQSLCSWAAFCRERFGFGTTGLVLVRHSALPMQLHESGSHGSRTAIYALSVRRDLAGTPIVRHRGILFTQPWVYVVLALRFFDRPQRISPTALVVTVGFLGVLGMNAGFSGWHAGAIRGTSLYGADISGVRISHRSGLRSNGSFREIASLLEPWEPRSFANADLLRHSLRHS